MAKGIQTSNGKAFEYACVDSLYRMLSREQEVIIEASASLETAKGFFENAAGDLKLNIVKAADAASKVIVRLEPQQIQKQAGMSLWLEFHC